VHFPPVLIEDAFTNEEQQALADVVHVEYVPFRDERNNRDLAKFKALKEFSEKLEPLARKIFNDPTLKSTYRVYIDYNDEDSTLNMHKDQNACVYTIDYCVSAETDWPLIVEGEEYSFKPGQALAFMGGEDLHGRNPKGAGRVENIMFHFCPEDHWWFTEGPDHIEVLKEAGKLTIY